MITLVSNIESNTVEARLMREHLFEIFEKGSIERAQEIMADAIVKKFGARVLESIKPRHIRNAVNTLVAKRLEKEIGFTVNKLK